MIRRFMPAAPSDFPRSRRGGVPRAGRLLVVLSAVAMALSPVLAGQSRLDLTGTLSQGGLVVGSAPAGSQVKLDGTRLDIAADGTFLIGFGRDAAAAATLEVTFPDGSTETRRLGVAARSYDVQRIDGLPRRKVTPRSPEDLARIGREKKAIESARARIDVGAPLAASTFDWPAIGRVSGVYGSQRVLNGVPKRPHLGVDVAAPAGTPVVAAAAGTVLFTHPGMFFNGKTVLIDHGLGLTSIYIHMNDVAVEAGQEVRKGQRIGAVGQSGRATGPHLHWEVNLGPVKLDPALLVGPMPARDGN